MVAPALVPQQPGRRVKTDRRDAARLARYLRSGDLTGVYVADEVSEAICDPVRARFDAKRAERVARAQLFHFLLRHGPANTRVINRRSILSALVVSQLRGHREGRSPGRNTMGP